MAAIMAIVFACPVFAEIEWLEKIYNFGAFKEAEGPRRGIARFVNKGSEPVFIKRVRPSCGCTEAAYTEGMIEPGDTAMVSFIFDPKGRPGSFEKTIKVYLGNESEMHVIRFAGTVIGAPSTLEFSYPKEAGPLRLESAAANTGELKKGSARHLFINAYNQSTDTITPVWECVERGVQVELTPKSIPPGDIATFGFYVNTSEEERMGPVDYKIDITADGRRPEEGSIDITISTIIVPDTQSMTVEEVENGPKAYLLPEFIDFGESAGENKVGFSFEILNEGKMALDVLRVYSLEECVEIKERPSKVKSGKKGKVKGELDLSKLASGAFRISVEVMTSDPLHPLRTANLVGVKE